MEHSAVTQEEVVESVSMPSGERGGWPPPTHRRQALATHSRAAAPGEGRGHRVIGGVAPSRECESRAQDVSDQCVQTCPRIANVSRVMSEEDFGGWIAQRQG